MTDSLNNPVLIKESYCRGWLKLKGWVESHPPGERYPEWNLPGTVHKHKGLQTAMEIQMLKDGRDASD